MASKGTILAVDDEPIVLRLLVLQVERLDYKVFSATSGEEALKILKLQPVDILITDVIMPQMDGITLMSEAAKIQPDIECLVVSGQAEVSTAVEAMKSGAINYIQKPISILELEVSLTKGMERIQLQQQLKKNQIALQEAAQELAAETSKNKMILEAAGEGIVGLDPEGRVTLMNPAALKMLGLKKETALDTPFADFIGPKKKKAAPSHPPPSTWLKKTRHDGTATFYRRGDKSLEVEYVSSPIKSEGQFAGSVVVFNDITERRKSERALEKSEAQLRTLMESTQVGIFLYQDDQVVFANPVLENIIGYSLAEINKMKRWEFIHPEHQQMVKEYGWARLAGKHAPARYEVKILTKKGEERWLDLLVNMITLEDTLTGLVSINDITERKRIETELSQYQEQLEQLVEERTAELAQTNKQLEQDIKARKKAEKEAEQRRQQLIEADKMVSLGILVAGVAHEINNPNNFITMNTPILHRAWDDFHPVLERFYEEEGDFNVAGIPYSEMRGHIPELFSGILDGSERIRKIVSNLRDYARQGVSDMSQLFDLNDALRAALVLLANPIKKSTHHLQVEYDRSLPKIKGNFQRSEQVIINLIQNAYQSLKSQDKGLVISTGHDPKSKTAYIEVRDEGCGIPPKHLKRIQDPFFTTKRDCGGSGLGLSISAGIMEEHGGRLEFQSNPNTGTTARASFPTTKNGD